MSSSDKKHPGDDKAPEAVLHLAETLAPGFKVAVFEPARCPLLWIGLIEEDREFVRKLFRDTDFPLHFAEHNENPVVMTLSVLPKLVFVDKDVPEAGLDALKHLKRHKDTCDIPVVLVSRSAQREDILEAVKAGCDAYVVKPLSESLVAKAYEIIQKAHGSREPIRSTLRYYLPGTRLLEEGQGSRTLYFIKSGRVGIHIERQGRDVPLAVLGEGDLLGEDSFLRGALPSATAIAETEITVLQLEATGEFESFFRTNHGFRELLTGVMGKLRKANETIAILSYQDYLKARHQGMDLTTELLYSEGYRLLSLLRLISLTEKTKSLDGLEARLVMLAGDTPLNLHGLLQAMSEQGFLVTSANGVATEAYLLDGMLDRLSLALKSKTFFRMTPVTLNLLKLLEALRPAEDVGAPFTVPVNLVNPADTPEVREALAALEDAALVGYADRERTLLRFTPRKLGFFMKWQSILSAIAPPPQAGKGASPVIPALVKRA